MFCLPISVSLTKIKLLMVFGFVFCKVVNDLVFSGSSDQSVHAHNIHVSLIYKVRMTFDIKVVNSCAIKPVFPEFLTD